MAQSVNSTVALQAGETFCEAEKYSDKSGVDVSNFSFEDCAEETVAAPSHEQKHYLTVIHVKVHSLK